MIHDTEQILHTTRCTAHTSYCTPTPTKKTGARCTPRTSKHTMREAYAITHIACQRATHNAWHTLHDQHDKLHTACGMPHDAHYNMHGTRYIPHQHTARWSSHGQRHATAPPPTEQRTTVDAHRLSLMLQNVPMSEFTAATRKVRRPPTG